MTQIHTRLLPIIVSIATMSGIVGHAQSRSAASRYRHDLQGVWDFSMLTPLERPADYRNKQYFTPEEASTFEVTLQRARKTRQEQSARGSVIGMGVDEEVWAEGGTLASINGRFPTSLIVDPPEGRLPALTMEAERRVAERRVAAARLDTAQDRSLSERCLRAASGPPYLPSPDANTLRIVQSPDHVALTVEKFGETRIVSLTRQRHVASVIRGWTGDAIGGWDADALVVDTVNFTPAIALTGNYDGNLHLIERFSRVDGNTLLYEATIDDPTAFVRSWKISVPMKKIASPLYEFACHESNYSMRNMLSGARAEERVH